MDKELKVSPGKQAMYILLGVGLFIFSLYLFTLPSHTDQPAILLMPLFFLAGAILIIANTFTRKILLRDDSIVYTNFFRTREIYTVDIKGYRVNNKVLTIESKSAEIKPIRIGNYIDFSDSFELVKWLKDNFKDVDEEDLQEQKEKLLKDTSLGVSEQDRQAKLDIAKKLAFVYNFFGAVIGVLVIIYASNIIIATLAMLYPFAGIVIMRLNRLIKFVSSSKRSVYPFIMTGIIVPGLVLFFEFTSTDTLDNQNLWQPFLGLTVVLAFLFYITGINESIGGKAGQILAMLAIALFYGFGSTMKINCAFDNSPDQHYKAAVLGHHISHGRHNSYILYLSTWGPCTTQKQIDVGSRIYSATNVGDSVKIDLKAGALHIPWFVVKKD